MKNRLFFALIIILLAGMAWWLWRVLGLATTEPITGRSATVKNAYHTSTQPSQAGQGEDTSSASASETNLTTFMSDLATEENRSIRFYGKVVDQDNFPVAGVKVTLGLRLLKSPEPGMAPGEMYEYPVVLTDSDGRFSLTDAQGKLLVVKSLQKEGYEASRQDLSRSFWYARPSGDEYTPDPDNPQLFRMWKKSGAEKLLVHTFNPGLPTDGTPIYFDLISGGRSANSADLKVSLTRNPEQITWGQRNFEWTVTVETLNDAGILASGDEQAFRAPEEGYRNQFVIHMPSDAPNWTNQKNIIIYLRLRDGQLYGRASLQMMVGSDRAITPFSMTTFVNPTGSQNLEYDPEQDQPPELRAQVAEPAGQAGAQPIRKVPPIGP